MDPATLQPPPDPGLQALWGRPSQPAGARSPRARAVIYAYETGLIAPGYANGTDG
jgi:hypothetical protein